MHFSPPVTDHCVLQGTARVAYSGTVFLFTTQQLYEDIWHTFIRYLHIFHLCESINYQSSTQIAYRKWCKENNFVSILLNDAKARCATQQDASTKQTAVDDHFSTQKLEDKPKPYSDSIFEEAAIQWLVETDQVCLLICMKL
jgi:hypothetical protein